MVDETTLIGIDDLFWFDSTSRILFFIDTGRSKAVDLIRSSFSQHESEAFHTPIRFDSEDQSNAP